MNRSGRFVLALVAAVAIAAAGSHGVAFWLKLKTSAAEVFIIGKSSGNPPAFLAASSVGGYGILWDQIAGDLNTQIKTWGIAGGSPIEFEQFQKKVPEARTTFIVVSTYDLDEAMPCDFRAAIVPLGQTLDSLRAEHADWKYSKTVLSQYPMTWLRTLFPTLGRSRGLMGAALIKLKDLARKSAGPSDTQVGPAIKFGKGAADDEYTRQRLSDWPPSKVINKLVAMKVEFQGAHSFNGAKARALERMLQYAEHRGGRMVLVVMPMSAPYTKGFVSPDSDRQFEAALAQVQREAPGAELVRLDRVPGLGADENFCDLVHLNVMGQKLATEALQARLGPLAHQP
ncbi:MAG TPA: hypothetical protein VL970_11210 [Candidatus Acidoferrales bacterium]|nr:hypothetical protein [Candidatus Acidoferrales bacterium]